MFFSNIPSKIIYFFISLYIVFLFTKPSQSFHLSSSPSQIQSLLQTKTDNCEHEVVNFDEQSLDSKSIFAQTLSRKKFMLKISSSLMIAGAALRAEAADKVDSIPSFKQDLWYDVDGALGIKWGAKDTCNPSEDIDCGVNGVKIDLSETQPSFSQSFFDVSDKCVLLLDIAGSKYELEIGLWRDAAPKSVDFFKKMCAANYELDEDDFPGLVIGYAGGAFVNEVKKNEKITFASSFVPETLKGRRKRADISEFKAPNNTEKNDAVKHDSAGIVSLKKGGGSFEFIITPRSNRKLDKDYIPIGQVLKGMEVIERINQAAINKYKNTPLKKISVASCSIIN